MFFNEEIDFEKKEFPHLDQSKPIFLEVRVTKV